jgi:hypothetical protein
MSKHIPVVYTLYKDDPDHWYYKYHGTLEQAYNQAPEIWTQSDIDSVAKRVMEQGRYIYIDDLLGFTHIVEKEIYKDKIV